MPWSSPSRSARGPARPRASGGQTQRPRAARAAGVHGMTDVTGFGLLGHLHELALASGVAAEVDAAAVPAIDGVVELLSDPNEGAVAGGTRRNRAHAEEFASFADSVPE